MLAWIAIVTTALALVWLLPRGWRIAAIGSAYRSKVLCTIVFGSGRSIDPQNWAPVEMTTGPSLWGHDRNWLSAEGRAQARALRLKAAAEGQREPVQVLDGNYTLAPGTCIWWDAARKR